MVVGYHHFRKPPYVYHLDSIWRNSHVLVYHGLLLSQLLGVVTIYFHTQCTWSWELKIYPNTYPLDFLANLIIVHQAAVSLQEIWLTIHYPWGATMGNPRANPVPWNPSCATKTRLWRPIGSEMEETWMDQMIRPQKNPQKIHPWNLT